MLMESKTRHLESQLTLYYLYGSGEILLLNI